ncbi:MAG: hypothetical protein J6A01_09865 [Proteobacteria bacterium]|nr:hypothetical protein [Pseudomonadota bacterium]
MKKIIIIAAASFMLISLGACNKKAEEPAKTDNTEAAQAVPADPAITPKDLAGTWIQTVDDDPSIYVFMEDGKCKAKGLTDKDLKDCTFKIKTPAEYGGRFNILTVDFPASGDNEQYYTKSAISLSGDMLTFPDDEGNVSEYNKYKKGELKAAPAKEDKAEEAPADAPKNEEDVHAE